MIPKGRIIVKLDNGKSFIVLPSSRIYQYCLKYLEAIPIPANKKGDINLSIVLILPEELKRYTSLEESTQLISYNLREISTEIVEMDNIWWSTSEWKFKETYNSRVDKFLVLVRGLGFLSRIDLLLEEEKYLESNGKEYIDPDNWYPEDYNTYYYLLEIIHEERMRWQRIQGTEQRHKLQGLQLV